MKSKVSVALLGILVFLLGGIGGAISHYFYLRYFFVPPNIVEAFARELKLDAKQKEQLRDIFNESRERYRALSLQFRPQYENIRNETDQQIRKILRDDQKAHFEDFLIKVHSPAANPPLSPRNNPPKSP
jgi:uncharacterized membrane protein